MQYITLLFFYFQEGDTGVHLAAKHGRSEVLLFLASKNKDLLALPNKVCVSLNLEFQPYWMII